MDTFTHREQCLEHIKDVQSFQLELDDAHADTTHPHRAVRIAKAHQGLRLSLRLAHIQATLDMGAAFREWTEVGQDDDPVPFTLVQLPAAEPAEAAEDRIERGYFCSKCGGALGADSVVCTVCGHDEMAEV